MIITLVTSSGALVGLYSQFYLIFLPLLSIFGSILIIKISAYLKNKSSVYQVVYGFIVLLLFTQLLNSKIKNTFFVKSPKSTKQMEFLDYVLKNSKRSEPVLFLWCEWGGYVFNSDIQYFWFENEKFISYYKKIAGYDVFGNSLIDKLKGKNVKYIIAPEYRFSTVLSKRAHDYVLKNYKRSKKFDDLWIRI